jgi:hypothetical protein
MVTFFAFSFPNADQTTKHYWILHQSDPSHNWQVPRCGCRHNNNTAYRLHIFISSDILRGSKMIVVCLIVKLPYSLNLLLCYFRIPTLATRVNGLDQFLETFNTGILVQRHWPWGKTFSVLLYPDDKGDTICCRYITENEAAIALWDPELLQWTKGLLSFGVSKHN